MNCQHHEAKRKAYEKVDLGYEIGKMITDARIAKNMTQARLAKLAGTKQPSIARVEKGNSLPSLSFLQKIAKAFNTQLLPPHLEFLEDGMTKPDPMAEDSFNPNDARTWDDKQQAVYETGHREGESCEGASWTLMLDGAFDIEASTPDEAKAAINAYTTNKIIGELERVRNSLSENTIEEVEIGKVYNRIAELRKTL